MQSGMKRTREEFFDIGKSIVLRIENLEWSEGSLASLRNVGQVSIDIESSKS